MRKKNIGFLAERKLTPEDERRQVLEALDYGRLIEHIGDDAQYLTFFDRINLRFAMFVTRFFYKRRFKRWEDWSMYCTASFSIFTRVLLIPIIAFTLILMYVL